MATGARVRRASATGRSYAAGESVALVSEEGRAFLQERLAFFGKAFFLIFCAFYVAGNLTPLPLPHYDWGLWFNHRANQMILAMTAVLLALWLVCRRGPLARRALEWIDTAALLLISAFNAGMVDASFELDPPGESRVRMLLTFTGLIVAHAVVVPSTPWRTLVLGVAATAPLLVTTYAYYARTAATPALALVQTGFTDLWCWSAVVTATVASHVIYGLREKVREARQLGQYTLEEKVGEGGMGAVYRASHAMLRRPTAVKLLPPEKAAPGALERFEREVQLTSRLTHPNTVSIFDYGRTADGVFYYAMEYLDGIDLEALVAIDGAQPPGRVVHVLTQVAGSLAEAHGIGLIHRDIKPANVILCDRGGTPDVAKVVDFGLVKQLGMEAELRLSGDHTIAGTPLFLSPEAITAPEQVGPRSDLYALGAVGYFVLTGRHVFSGKSLVEICGHHLHTKAPPPAERLGRPVPESLAALLLACLEKDPARRPASARALLEGLAACADVPRWTEADARAWWGQNAERVRGARNSADGHEVLSSALTLSVIRGQRAARAS